MALASGTRLGVYEIVESIGAGGMGEVYRATDTELRREVAVKILPDGFATDEDRLARFKREAEVLASLNHPNIAHIYGLERSEGRAAFIMELIDGPTLDERIAEGPLEIDEALEIAGQIAEAIGAAHDQGLVHRDLKPANVKLKPDGLVKVLDFGIAKAIDVRSSSGLSPVMTTPAMTETGVILGTAAYMSPEQARGKGVDARTDIWAFGCVLYEMLTGQPAFGGEDVTVTLARILERDVDLAALPATVTDAVAHTIELCLQKNPRKRIAHIRDVQLALSGAFDTGGRRSGRPRSADGTVWRSVLPIAAAALIAGSATGLAAWRALQPEPATVRRFDYDLPDGVAFRNGGRPVLTVSPNGSAFAFNTLAGLRVRRLDSLDTQLVAGTEDVMSSPTFSADGQALVFWGDTNGAAGGGQLKRIAATGGATVDIAENIGNVYGLRWEPDDTILFGQSSGIMRVPATGGRPELIVPADEGMLLYGPQLLPGGDDVLFSISPPGEWDDGQIFAQSLSTGERRVLVERGYDARYLPSGHLVYVRGNTLFGIAFDADRLTVSGGSVPLAQGVLRANARNTGAANFGVSNDGTLVYATDEASFGVRTLIVVDRAGNETDLGVPARRYGSVQLSPDGSRIALTTIEGESDVWILDVAANRLQQFTFDDGEHRNAIWSPDGQRIAFSQEVDGRQEIAWQAADRSGTLALLTEGSETDVVPTSFTPDGSALIYATTGENADVWSVPVAGPTNAATPLLAGPADERSASVSPDGRWIAYESNESGRFEVWIRSFPNVSSGGRWQVSTAGGTAPQWGSDARELFYFIDDDGPSDQIMIVPLEVAGATLRPGVPRPVDLEGDHAAGPGGLFYDVYSDGEHFAALRVNRGSTSQARSRFIIVENWISELERLAPTD